jgi:hypothetical protein
VAAGVLESYLNSSLHFRGAKGLLERVLEHTTSLCAADLATVAALLAMRLKPVHNQLFNEVIHNRPRPPSY